MMYCPLQTLYEEHSQFLEQLLSANSEYSRITISDCFIMFKERFLIYGDFCTNLPKATKLVEQLCKTNPQIKSAITVSLYDESVVHFGFFSVGLNNVILVEN